jgi:hypothetical protein
MEAQKVHEIIYKDEEISWQFEYNIITLDKMAVSNTYHLLKKDF